MRHLNKRPKFYFSTFEIRTPHYSGRSLLYIITSVKLCTTSGPVTLSGNKRQSPEDVIRMLEAD